MTALIPVPSDLESFVDEENPDVRGLGWKIENIQTADWGLARLSELEQEIRDVQVQAERAKGRIDARAATLIAKAQRGVGYFRFKLLEYAETHRNALLGHGKKKSRAFVHGSIGWKAKGGRLVVKDPKALEEWLLAQPIERGLYRVKYEPEMRALQELNKATGEVPPGMDYQDAGEEAFVKAEPLETGLVKGDGNV